MSAPVLEITNLHKRFGQLEVLKGIDLTMHKGDVVSLIGSSGSGKTTLLRCVNLLERYEEGSVAVAGEQIGYTVKNGKRVLRSEKDIARQRRVLLPANGWNGSACLPGATTTPLNYPAASSKGWQSPVRLP